MHLIQLLVPLYDNDGQQFDSKKFVDTRQELSHHFGGLTVYSQSPAEGLWKESGGNTHRDSLVLFEVLADHLDKTWWNDYREKLESRFRQQELMIRAQTIEKL